MGPRMCNIALYCVTVMKLHTAAQYGHGDSQYYVKVDLYMYMYICRLLLSCRLGNNLSYNDPLVISSLINGLDPRFLISLHCEY